MTKNVPDHGTLIPARETQTIKSDQETYCKIRKGITVRIGIDEWGRTREGRELVEWRY
jgi:hypothetical protein